MLLRSESCGEITVSAPSSAAASQRRNTKKPNANLFNQHAALPFGCCLALIALSSLLPFHAGMPSYFTLYRVAMDPVRRVSMSGQANIVSNLAARSRGGGQNIGRTSGRRRSAGD